MKRQYLLYFCLLAACLCLTCDQSSSVNVDLDEIKERGKLTAITAYSSTSYLIYRGQPMGFEYELLKRLAEHMDLELEIVIAHDLDRMPEMLLAGEGDIIAYGLTVTKKRRQLFNFTEEIASTYQVLVQRKPENWRDMKLHEINRELIRNPIDLIGKEVHVREGSSYYERLLNLEEEIGGDIDIVSVPGNTTTEQLIAKVARGQIDYTISDQNIAYINRTYYSDLDVQTRISFAQKIAWAVRKESEDLLRGVNEWIAEMKKGTDYYVIYNKYFKNTKASRRRLGSEFSSTAGGGLSQYDSLIQQYATDIDWDWRLLASMVYQESQFDPEANSWAGAVGLMQMMPAMAEEFGIDDPTDPESSIRAGTAYIAYLQDLYKDLDKEERVKFVLGSYNVGENHIADARRLAEKYGFDPDVWEGNVDFYLLQLSNPSYYNDEVVYYGYCRGQEPHDYVIDILDRFEHYKRLIPAEPNDQG